MTSVLTREGDIHTEERPWEKQAEIRVTRLQAEERLEPPEPGGDKGQTLSQSFQKKPAPPTPRFQTVVS